MDKKGIKIGLLKSLIDAMRKQETDGWKKMFEPETSEDMSEDGAEGGVMVVQIEKKGKKIKE